MPNRIAKLSELVGVTMESVEVSQFDDEVIFKAVDGRRWKLFHEQECCENVTLEDIVGESEDLIGTPMLIAEERSNADSPEGWEEPNFIESYTWTFYEFATIKGTVTLRWFGESNGCYSEGVDFIAMEGA